STRNHHLARIRLEQTADDRDCRRLPGPVRTQQPVRLALGNLETDPAHRLEVAEALVHVLAREHDAGCRLRRQVVQTRFGTLPVSVRTARIALWPRSAVGPNMHGQPPSITVMPCSRP